MTETKPETFEFGPQGNGIGAELKPTYTAGSVQIPAELFEQLYLAPKGLTKGDLHRKFGNPTPVALGAFLMCTTALSMTLLGWQGADALGAAFKGAYIFMGGLTQFLGAIGEWIIGNTFPSVVFFLFGGFWMAFAYAVDPTSGAVAAYSPDPSIPAKGLENPAFFSTFAFFLVSLTLIIFFFTIASIRTNFMLFFTLLTLLPSSGCLTAGFFALGQGHHAAAEVYQTVGAGLLLAASLEGWYIFLSMVLMAVDFPIPLPMGDLSTVIKANSQLRPRKARENTV